LARRDRQAFGQQFRVVSSTALPTVNEPIEPIPFAAMSSLNENKPTIDR
jgi:hypothetical protein